MSKVNADVIAEYTKKQKEKDERRKAGEGTSAPPVINIGPRISDPIPPSSGQAEIKTPVPITVIHPDDLQPRKRARADQGTSSSAPSTIAGVESFAVTDPKTAVIAANSATSLIKSLQEFAAGIGGKAVEERDALRNEIGNLKKANSELKKQAKEAIAAQKKAEEGVTNAKNEVTQLKEEVSKLKETIKSVENSKNELELKAAEDLSSAEKRIQDLGNELEEMTGECIGIYKEGYDQCINHIKFMFPDLDTSMLSCTKKIEDGKLVDAAQ